MLIGHIRRLIVYMGYNIKNDSKNIVTYGPSVSNGYYYKNGKSKILNVIFSIRNIRPIRTLSINQISKPFIPFIQKEAK